MKFIFVLGISVFVTVSLGMFVKQYQKHDQISLVSPLVAGVSTDIPTPSNHNYVGSDYLGWQTFVNNYTHYQIKHPSDVFVKNGRNGDVTLIKNKTINIYIAQGELSSKDTLNTLIEVAIDHKKSQLNNNFTLIGSISPIAIGSVTAQTFSSTENGHKASYFYVPQNTNKYLIISSQSDDPAGDDYLIAEKIVFSLELLP
jgi:hypothetical protein